MHHLALAHALALALALSAVPAGGNPAATVVPGTPPAWLMRLARRSNTENRTRSRMMSSIISASMGSFSVVGSGRVNLFQNQRTKKTIVVTR